MNYLSPEFEKQQPTILDNLNKLLKPQNEWEMKELYEMLASNEHVLQSGYRPTLEHFRNYFELVKKGFEYVRDTYGLQGLPSEICVYQGVMTTGELEDADWVGYLPEKDQFGVSLLHIAGQAVHYDDPSALFTDSHLPKRVGIKGRDYTVLQSVEEGYHRFQIRELGFIAENTMRNIENPLEAGIIPVFEKAITDLEIQTYSITEM